MEKKYIFTLKIDVTANDSTAALEKIFNYAKSIDVESFVLFDSIFAPDDNRDDVSLFNYTMVICSIAEDSGAALKKIINYIKETPIEKLVAFEDLTNDQVEISLNNTKKIDDDDNDTFIGIEIILDNLKEVDVDTSISSMNPPVNDGGVNND